MKLNYPSLYDNPIFSSKKKFPLSMLLQKYPIDRSMVNSLNSFKKVYRKKMIQAPPKPWHIKRGVRRYVRKVKPEPLEPVTAVTPMELC